MNKETVKNNSNIEKRDNRTDNTKRDNRDYHWKSDESSIRPEYPHIIRWIKPGSSVIDFGCGNGALLKLLEDKNCKPLSGIEISQSGADICRKLGFDIRQGRADVRHSDIEDKTFDFSVCNVTLQMVMYPEILLKEMKRVSREIIVSFPNFAFITQRLDLLFHGRMPRRLLYGYKWHSTGHIHQLSINDFKNTVAELNLEIVDGVYLVGKHRLKPALLPNLLSTAAIFRLKSNFIDP